VITQTRSLPVNLVFHLFVRPQLFIRPPYIDNGGMFFQDG
jgi:hypothetical protein